MYKKIVCSKVKILEKIYLNEYILSYKKITNMLDTLCIKNKNIIKEYIGKTAFGYDILSFTIGKGNNHVLLIGTTHGLEIITTYFVIEFMLTVLNDEKLQKKYTFHFIPVLNPEGYIISSSNVLKNIYGLNEYEFEMLSTTYLKEYNKCDELSKKGEKITNGFYCILNSNLNNIDNFYLRKNVERILRICNLSENVLPIWAANGLGVDQNSNSIHKFKDMKYLRNCQKCAALRYNIIPVTIPSPMSYPGEFTFDRSLENLSLYRYISKLYNNCNLKYIFSYHSTGGEIYGYPEDCEYNKLKNYKENMEMYSYYTGYKIINEKLKYGVMDYYRKYLGNTICLTIELSKYNGNPIGPFCNLIEFKNDILNNKKALIKTIN